MDDAEPGNEGRREPADTEPQAGDADSTVGTGSMLGIGCLVVVALFVLIAVAFRWFGSSW